MIQWFSHYCHNCIQSNPIKIWPSANMILFFVSTAVVGWRIHNQVDLYSSALWPFKTTVVSKFVIYVNSVGRLTFRLLLKFIRKMLQCTQIHLNTIMNQTNSANKRVLNHNPLALLKLNFLTRTLSSRLFRLIGDMSSRFNRFVWLTY